MNIDNKVQEIIDNAKNKMKSVFNEILDEVYCEVIPFYEDNLFANMRTQIISSIEGYKKDIASEYDWVNIRSEILKENREQIICDLNQDNLIKIEKLEKEIQWLKDNQ